jgi:hypothetical protein
MHARAPGGTGTQHEADVIVTDDRGRKKARMRRIPFKHHLTLLALLGVT